MSDILFKKPSKDLMRSWPGKRRYTSHSVALPVAKKALVFMLVSPNCHWKIPVGYFLINGLNAIEKAALVGKCLQFVHESGVFVTSPTYDGGPVNMTMANVLGADFKDAAYLKTSFYIPFTNEIKP